MFAITNVRIYDYQKYIDNGFIIFDEHIVEVGLMESFLNKDHYQVIDGQGKIIIPGFISGHTHLYSTFARGLSLDFNPKNFLDILKQMWWKVDHFLDLNMIFYSALMGGIDQLQSGTTALIDHHASYKVNGSLNQIKKALNDVLGMRSVLAFETSDRFDLMAAIKENIDFISENQSPYISGLFGMHASLSLSDDSLKKIGENLRGQGIHIHVGESLLDEERCIEQYGKRVVERLDDFQLINEKSLLVHCTHINDAEIEIIKKRKATIAINPTSNLNNAVGISHVKKFLDDGIRVILGNDGLIQSQAMEYLNTYYLGHLKNESPIGFTLGDLHKIMRNTYDYINERLMTKLGVFEKDCQADLLVIPYEPYTEINSDNVFGHLFFGVFPGLKPQDVFIGGKHLIKDYHLNFEHTEYYEKARQESNKLWNILKKEGKDFEFKNKF
ncbi:MAG: amidohydrolase family protein [Candidatus Izemoplasmatales bacterium]